MGIKLTKNKYIDQVIRPTGLIDPPVEIKPAKTQVDDLMHEAKGYKKRLQNFSNNPNKKNG